MSVTASLKQISADVYEKVKAGGGIDKEDLDLERTVLSRSWYVLHIVSKQMPPPLRYFMSGDYVHPLGAPDIDSFRQPGYEDFYLGFMSPSLVKQVADDLSLLPREELARFFERAGKEFDDYFQHYFDAIKQAYSNAAEKGNALNITIA